MVKAKMIDVNVLLTFWQFFSFRIKCTFVFCLSFLNETEQKKIKKFCIKQLAIDSRLSIVIA